MGSTYGPEQVTSVIWRVQTTENGVQTMFDISFTIDGRKVSPDRLGDELQKAMLRDISEKLRRRIASMRCPEHGRAPRAAVRGRSINRLSLTISGCCDEFVESASKNISLE